MSFDKIDRFIRVYDGTRYLVLFGSEKCGSIYNKIKTFIGVKVVLHILFPIIMEKSK